ncbi:MAG: hypothetical protein CSA22_05070 [Deltaproteobacteria bacterium]|nr:MAG: hypothetical protein CSA22_05070 [Deltaproteobacteria bacterium]
MLSRYKNRIKAYIQQEIKNRLINLNASDNNLTPNHRNWENQISINPENDKIVPLDCVSNYVHGETYINPADIGLPEAIESYINRDPYPLPSTADREGYMGERHYEFWLFGLKDYFLIKQVAMELGHTFKPGYSVFDMGCASGRVIRHFLCQEKELDLWCSDINARHIDWVSTFFNESLNAFQNHSLPHLPMSDNSIDLVYAFSVFSHIESFERTWLYEIRRILKPGGIAYLTIHSDHTWSIMKKGHEIFDSLLSHPDFTPEMTHAKLPKEKMIFRWESDASYTSNVFYASDYIRKVWGRILPVIKINHEMHNYQDVVVLQKKG